MNGMNTVVTTVQIGLNIHLSCDTYISSHLVHNDKINTGQSFILMNRLATPLFFSATQCWNTELDTGVTCSFTNTL